MSGDRAGHRGGGVPRDRAVERRAGGSEQRGMLILILVTPLLFAYGEVRVRGLGLGIFPQFLLNSPIILPKGKKWMLLRD